METKKLTPKNRRYLGSKSKLLFEIKKIVERECHEVRSILDLFAGTGVVGYEFNNEHTSVIVNDNLVSNYYSYLAWFGDEEIDLLKISSQIEFYNNAEVTEDNYVSLNFADTYFSKAICRKIGFIRQDIESLSENGSINKREKAILITSLLFSADKIANTVGHYDSYRRDGDFDRDFKLFELELGSRVNNKNNQVFCMDSNDLVKFLKVDLVYIDPPYNSRQYCDAYHFLENIAEWRKPEVKGEARKFDRSEKKSRYSLKSAPKAFADLIEDVNAKYILVSYNNMGSKGASRSNAKISDFEILRALSKKGQVKEFTVDYQQFTTGKSCVTDHKERLFLCQVGVFDEVKTKKSNENIIAKSPLNYTGGKHKLVPQLIEKFPKDIEFFVDLFGGGFNVGANVVAKTHIYNDIQVQVEQLIELFYKINSVEIIEKIELVIKKYGLSESSYFGYGYYGCNSDSGLGEYNRDKYYNLRRDYNNSVDSFERYFMLLTLIVFSFNNQIRFNVKGEFNMPVGKRDFNSSIRKNLILFSDRLKIKDIKFFSVDYREVSLPLDSFVYCDPPYLLGTATYNESDGWNEKQEIELLNYLENLDKKGVKFALSNVIEHKGHTNETLFNWIEKNHFNKIYIKSNYKNANYQIKDKDSLTREVLVTNY